MAKNLVIVESPAKAKTIEKFLGKEFKVASSFGHIADLPAKELGVDVSGDFSAKYIPKSKKDRKWKSHWVFSIYNAYNRRNAASITFRQERNTGINEALRLSIFGIIPSVSYNFKF